jgi:ribosome recycling factor
MLVFSWSQPFKSSVEEKMERTVQSLSNVYNSLRLNGGSVAAAIEKTMVPLTVPKPTVAAVASISSVRVTSPSTIIVEPFDVSNIRVIESSIISIGMGLSVNTNINQLTVTVSIGCDCSTCAAVDNVLYDCRYHH